MKGVIFNLLEQVVVVEHGEDAWDEMLDAVGTDGVYAAVGQYDDEELVALVGAASGRLGVSEGEVLEWFGANAIGMLAEAYPAFFEMAGSLRPFLLSLNDVIHREVRKLYPGAVVPTFAYEDRADGALLMTYDSPRSLCALARGFARGAAAWFEEDAVVADVGCRLEGDEACVLEVVFLPK